MKQRVLTRAVTARRDGHAGVELFRIPIEPDGDEAVLVAARGHVEVPQIALLPQHREQERHGDGQLSVVAQGLEELRVGRCRVPAARQLREILLGHHVGDAGRQGLIQDPRDVHDATATEVDDRDRRRAVVGRALADVVQQVVLNGADGELGPGAEVPVDALCEVTERAQVRLQDPDLGRVGMPAPHDEAVLAIGRVRGYCSSPPKGSERVISRPVPSVSRAPAAVSTPRARHRVRVSARL